ncbi:MAG: hypothetical protein IT460_11480 [Planctomycetes bacterium]|nr:hypothetical protein [Planctomycetota bacterium]
MALSLASGWLRDGVADLVRTAEAARALGFTGVFASRAPADAAAGRATVRALGLAVAGVQTDPVEDPAALRAALDRAAAGAATLRQALVVVDAGPARPRGDGPDGKHARERAVERWSRALHASLSAWPGLAVAWRGSADADGLFRADETAWLLDDHADRPVGLWLDPVRAARRAPTGAAGPERGPADGDVLAWADRFARRTMGLAVHGVGAGGGHAPPEDGGTDWGTLLGLVPARAARVLDVGPAVPAGAVADVRRWFEETLGG